MFSPHHQTFFFFFFYKKPNFQNEARGLFSRIFEYTGAQRCYISPEDTTGLTWSKNKRNKYKKKKKKTLVEANKL
jgi:hypothetical protein